MKRSITALSLVLLTVFSVGCLFSPRLNLERLGTIGFIGFDSRTRGNISDYAGQVFLEVLLRSQPRARIKELGPSNMVLGEYGSYRLTPEALDTLGKRYNVDAVLIGTLDFSKIRPRVDLASIIIGSIQASVDVDVVMSAKLLDTHDGTTFWADSARVRMDVANVSVFKGGDVVFDAQDPERAYGDLIQELVLRTTRDFRFR
ncbi:MAG: hypothetical protein NTW38_07795 [Candidatus Aminicenantes bacterium]|nr:hypothetical protein [Candidatus Aminicenantes bacterium]